LLGGRRFDSDASGGGPMSRALRVLLVEDREEDATLLLRELRRSGYDPISQRVETRESLDRALDEPWELILCDYNMPALDALTALRIVRDRHIDTPFIIVSGTIGEERAVAGLRSGAQDFVLKDKLARLAPAVARELRDSETRIKRAHAENALRATEESFRGAFELIPDAVLVCRDDLVVHANGSAVTMLAASGPDALVRRPFLDLFASSDRDSVRERMRSLRGSQGRVAFGELSMVRLDGRLVHVETTAMSVLFERSPAVLGVIRDVSARRELIARTMQVDRMIAVGTLAAGVGHEINNPLAYVMANVTYAREQVRRTQQALEKLPPSDASLVAAVGELTEVVAVLAEVEEGTRRIRDIACDLSTFARNDEELRLVDLRSVADSALRMAAAEARGRARIVRRYEPVPCVLASPSRVSQVFLNLIINAAHAIPAGAYESNEIAVAIRPQGGRVVVEVTDTGCGIAVTDRDQLFTPFFTTKPVGQGTGLGLSISRRIVRALGGEIEVESEVGRGTTMRVVLPAAADVGLREAPPPKTAVPRARLLFIDDERLVGTAFQRALSREHDVVVAQSADDALRRLMARERFDVVFCDVNMTLVTGALHRQMPLLPPHTAGRLVLISDGMQRAATHPLGERPGIARLEKPLDMAQVRALLTRILGEAGVVPLPLQPSGDPRE
jgi:PAS domain S-box-containing protein